ncbi:hypothetical protein WH47_03523 [Habropoda laboriosa]|uniref:Uncharacterized protein n=1 Tax=Habropoda laboriosa TaxID=597456 RepID=A0A0L7RC53_9HYME|nr:hypothetical protein WH47_03523 [Habropoda laboriosa]
MEDGESTCLGVTSPVQSNASSIAFFVVDAFPASGDERGGRFLDGIPERVTDTATTNEDEDVSRRRGHCSSASPRFLVVAVDRSRLNFLGGHATKHPAALDAGTEAYSQKLRPHQDLGKIDRYWAARPLLCSCIFVAESFSAKCPGDMRVRRDGYLDKELVVTVIRQPILEVDLMDINIEHFGTVYGLACASWRVTNRPEYPSVRPRDIFRWTDAEESEVNYFARHPDLSKVR